MALLFRALMRNIAMDKLADRNRTNATFVTGVEEVYESSSCTDDLTLAVFLKHSSAALMTLLSRAHVAMMKKDIAKAVDRKDTKFLVGTGSFKFKPYTPGVNFQAERNPNYWKPGLSHIDGYRAVVMADLTMLFASFPSRQRTMTGIGRHLERPEADIRERDFPDGVELMLRRRPLYERGALSRQDDLRKIGINLKLTLLDTAALTDRPKRATSRHTRRWRRPIWMTPTCTTCGSPAMPRPITENTAILSSINYSKHRVVCLMSRTRWKLPKRQSTSCLRTFLTIAAITGNQLWATRIGCK